MIGERAQGDREPYPTLPCPAPPSLLCPAQPYPTLSSSVLPCSALLCSALPSSALPRRYQTHRAHLGCSTGNMGTGTFPKQTSSSSRISCSTKARPTDFSTSTAVFSARLA